jgi:primosomal protein N' (replication factor Y)
MARTYKTSILTVSHRACIAITPAASQTMTTSMNILRVALDVPLNTSFDYLDTNSDVQPGQRVLVSFSGRRVIGIVLQRVSASDVPLERLKPILRAFDDEPPLLEATLRLLRFCTDYYHYPFGQALLAVLPARLREAKPAKLLTHTLYQLSDTARAAGVEALPSRAVLQRRLYLALAKQALDQSALAAVSSGWRTAIGTLMAQGLVVATETAQVSSVLEVMATIQPALNEEQLVVLEVLQQGMGAFGVSLLHGVTGSGKTEVYMRLLERVLAHKDTQALVLVPEINLTPQLEARFRNRFPQFEIVALHSGMADGERLQNWLLAQSGRARIVIGTRLSVFTPMPHLRLVVVDEEHDASYKQQDGMRYSARDVAIMRAKIASVPILLGSATPALETWHNAQLGRYRLLTLSQRAVSNATMPSIHCVDVRRQTLDDGLSKDLLTAIEDRLARREQSLLFINRRGFAPVLLCSACVWVAPCHRCSSRLVVHLRDRRLRCHHCGLEERMPVQCPQCGNADLHPTGQGTQRLETTLARRFPEARILRVDRDSMRRKHAIQEMTDQVHAQEVDILIGTQMLTKGHDFPNLTLVGVVDTDSALFSPDFRAAERLFAQLMQVAGRAGRADKPGEVLIQTAFPDHVLFNALRRQDYAAFAATLLEERKLAQFPPYCFEALLRAEAGQFAQVRDFLQGAVAATRQIDSAVTVYDPIQPQMARLNGMERAQLLIQADSRSQLQKFLGAWVVRVQALPLANRVRWSLDVDPLEN